MRGHGKIKSHLEKASKFQMKAIHHNEKAQEAIESMSQGKKDKEKKSRKKMK